MLELLASVTEDICPYVYAHTHITCYILKGLKKSQLSFVYLCNRVILLIFHTKLMFPQVPHFFIFITFPFEFVLENKKMIFFFKFTENTINMIYESILLRFILGDTYSILRDYSLCQ